MARRLKVDYIPDNDDPSAWVATDKTRRRYRNRRTGEVISRSVYRDVQAKAKGLRNRQAISDVRSAPQKRFAKSETVHDVVPLAASDVRKAIAYALDTKGESNNKQLKGMFLTVNGRIQGDGALIEKSTKVVEARKNNIKKLYQWYQELIEKYEFIPEDIELRIVSS